MTSRLNGRLLTRRSAATPELDDDLERVLTRLWSGGGAGEVAMTVGRRRLPQHQLVDAFVAVPSAARPRFLVPRGQRRAMASSLMCYVALRRPVTRVLRRALAAASLTGAVGSLLGDIVGIWLPASLDDNAVAQHAFTAHIRRELGASGALVAMGMPELDAHYKPTAQVFSANGAPLAFAKLGWTEATGALVRRETIALQAWRERPGRLARVPNMLLSGEWSGLPFVVTRPLPLRVEGVDDGDPLPDVVRDIAGDCTEVPLSESPYWSSVHRRLDAAAASRPGDALVPALRWSASVLDEVAGHRLWTFGRWHGDWVPWNIARAAGGVYVWDWEHSTECAPWGFDLLHWQITVPHLRHRVAYRDCVAAAARSPLLPRVSLPPGVLLLAYLMEMGLRSLELQNSRAQSAFELYPGLVQQLSGIATAVRAGGAK